MKNREQSSLQISRVRQGNQSDLGALLDSFRPLMLQLAQQPIGLKLQVRISGSDLVQETLLSASQNLESFRGDSIQELRQWLRYTEQLGFEEIAKRVNLPLSNVWRRWSRAIAYLRKHLDQ